MPSRRCCDLTVSQIAFLHDPDLVRIAPGAPPRNITGGQDLNLGCELKVGHKVGLSTEASPASDGPRRRRTINATQYFDSAPEISWGFYIGGYQPAQKWLKDRKGRSRT